MTDPTHKPSSIELRMDGCAQPLELRFSLTTHVACNEFLLLRFDGLDPMRSVQIETV